ncbi:hypothetical protein D3P08_21265 [Paenibacillus nanensis]|uniref:Uncharacterized protein n=1 Tax=Paenibacillus nanensis TaxID=393251 RepID=A0A3A1UP13_9BACL|nr:hypothetical protein [Paenibacillus nanensis]RIX50084.1 hypothetical protein D3P08_21265 [Paenibacillus nanensis]
MRKVWTIFSLLFILFGVAIQFITNLIDALVPKLGFAAYQAAAAGSFTPENYKIDLSSNYWLGSLCILFGVGALIIIWHDYIRLLMKKISNHG